MPSGRRRLKLYVAVGIICILAALLLSGFLGEISTGGPSNVNYFGVVSAQYIRAIHNGHLERRVALTLPPGKYRFNVVGCGLPATKKPYTLEVADAAVRYEIPFDRNANRLTIRISIGNKSEVHSFP